MFMGAPFIHCEPRDLHESLRIPLFAFSLLYALIVIFLFACAIIPLILIFSRSYTWLGLLIVLLYRAIILLKRFRNSDELGNFIFKFIDAKDAWLRERLFLWAEKAQNETLGRLALPNLQGISLPVLCVTAKGDEAFWGLRISRALANLPYMFWQPRSQGIIAAAVTVAVPVSIFFPNLLPILAFYTFLDFFPFLLIKVVIVYLLIALGIRLLMLILPYVTLSQFVFGGETIVDSWFTFITVKRFPPGTENHSQPGIVFPVSESRTNIHFKSYDVKGRGLRHCLIYNSESFLNDIESLILNRFSANKVHAESEASGP
jgi:hypothetical protein